MFWFNTDFLMVVVVWLARYFHPDLFEGKLWMSSQVSAGLDVSHV